MSLSVKINGIDYNSRDVVEKDTKINVSETFLKNFLKERFKNSKVSGFYKFELFIKELTIKLEEKIVFYYIYCYSESKIHKQPISEVDFKNFLIKERLKK